ncbi:hypothetical protein R1sor_008675 [Riccia sorocarpa]|uniref:PB1 domain-containing protein n=1 Tax=Riccia sorocarpa TaxID=122646 RepID=A0ABD3HXJ1_9MARC
MSNMTYTIKVAFEDDLRRLTFDTQPGTAGGLSFAQLEAQVRELFDVPAVRKLKFTYVDCDLDVVTMANERDLKEACVGQRLNPLRIKVVLIVKRNNRTMSNDDDEQEDKEAELDQEEEEEEEKVEEEEEESSSEKAATEDDEEVHDAMCDGWDGCRMYPIRGKRYRSTTTEDYDLCSSCYEQLGQHERGGYELVAAVDPLAQVQANMTALAIQNMKMQTHMALLQFQRNGAQAQYNSIVSAGQSLSRLADGPNVVYKTTYF